MFLGALLDAGVPFELLPEDRRRPEHRGDAGDLARGPRRHLRDQARRGGGRRERPAARGVLGAAPCRARARVHDVRNSAASHATHQQHRRSSERNPADHRRSSHQRAAPSKTASEIFLALGAAEAKVHNVGIEHIHFHEVGAADAIVDIVCAAVGAEALGVEQFVCFAAQRWRRNGRVRPRGLAGSRSGDSGIAEGTRRSIPATFRRNWSRRPEPPS